MVSVGAAGHDRHPSRDARALASRRLLLLLALEIAFAGRPQIDTELRALVRRMSIENPLQQLSAMSGKLKFPVQSQI